MAIRLSASSSGTNIDLRAAAGPAGGGAMGALGSAVSGSGLRFNILVKSLGPPHPLGGAPGGGEGSGAASLGAASGGAATGTWDGPPKFPPKRGAGTGGRAGGGASGLAVGGDSGPMRTLTNGTGGMVDSTGGSARAAPAPAWRNSSVKPPAAAAGVPSLSPDPAPGCRNSSVKPPAAGAASLADSEASSS